MTNTPPDELDENPIYVGMFAKLGQTFRQKEKEEREIWKANLHDQILEDIQIDLLRDDMRLKFLQTQVRNFLERQESAHFLFSMDTLERILHNSLYRMLKQLRDIKDPVAAPKYLGQLHDWYRQQKATSKVVKSANAPLDFDRLSDNAEALQQLTTQLEDFQIRQQQRIDAAKAAIKAREKRERAEKRARNLRKHTVVVRASSVSDSVDGVHRNLIPDETRKMS